MKIFTCKRLMDQRRFRLWWKSTISASWKHRAYLFWNIIHLFTHLPVVCICRSFTWSHFLRLRMLFRSRRWTGALGHGESMSDELGKIFKRYQHENDWPNWSKFHNKVATILEGFFLHTGNRLPRRPELQEKGLRLVNRLVTTCERDVPWIEGQQRRLWQEKHLLVLNLVKSTEAEISLKAKQFLRCIFELCT